MPPPFRFAILATLVGIGTVAIPLKSNGQEPHCDSIACESKCKSSWWISANALFLTRTQNNVQTFVINETNESAVLTGSDLEFGTAAGPRFAFGREWGSGLTTELVYFGMHDWSASARAVGNNNLSLPGDLGLATFDFFAADAIDIRYGSRIQNVEANLWSPCDSWEWLAGFRHFSVIEDFKIASLDVDSFLSDYQIHTNNQLYGGQIGLRKRWTSNRLGFSPEAKFGLLGNANNQHSVIRDLNNTLVLRDESVSSSILSSLSELRLVGDASITDRVKVNFGYNLIWLTGIAQAPYQYDTTFTATSSRFVDDNHGIFFHGASVGLTCTR
jgi:hypothetical protein